MYYLGVDGGGTKTAFILISEEGFVLSKEIMGTSHPDQIGLENVEKVLREGLEQVCQKAGVNQAEIAYSVWGLPGYGENLADEKALKKVVGEILKSDNYKCVNDVEVGWAGSLACQPGLHLVAGTGAIGFGKSPNGQTARSSGWSEVFGDEGSAYWLGRKLLQLFSKQADFRLPRTPLYRLVREYFGLTRDLDLIPLIAKASRDETAKAAKVVYKAALAGDEHALNLYQKAALEHSQTLQALLKQLNFTHQPVPASYSGGVFLAGDFILKPLKNYLKPLNIKLQEPELSPILGAALLALDLSGTAWSKKTVFNLKESG
ncbi:MAG TPA: ATPase [Firmicutes bacterium]|nr:ATPase [Bacillota bacterium]